MLKKIKTSPIHHLGLFINFLKEIDSSKAKKQYKQISLDDLKKSVRLVTIQQIGIGLSQLCEIDFAKARKLYEQISPGDLKKSE